MPLQVKKKKRKTFPIKVTTMDAELEFEIEVKDTGQDLFDLVCRTIGLRETWYFGLQYQDTKGYFAWLKLDKKVVDQDLPKSKPVSFMFLVKFYPEIISEELIQEITQHLFFLQVKQAIINMDIYCPAEASVLLASYALQAKYGDLDNTVWRPGMLSNDDLLPQKVIDQYQMTPDMWEDRIRVWYADHKGMLRDEAEMEYLKIAQDLDMYGINYFPISNKKDSELWLGVTALGLNIYDKSNKLTPKITFMWSEIRNLSFDDKKFIIKPMDKNAPNFMFFSKNLRINKFIFDLCIGNHELYMRRRKPDSIEVQQMKSQAEDEKRRRQVERNKLARERELRKETEREKFELEKQLVNYREEMRRINEQLQKAEQSMELLAEKTRIAEEESLLLRRKGIEMEAEIQRIRFNAIKTEEEKFMMERKVKEAEIIANSMIEESERRSKEAQGLKHELSKARMAEQNAKEKLREILNQQLIVSSTVPSYPTISTPPDLIATELKDIYSEAESSIPVVTYDLIKDGEMQQLSMEIEKERMEYIEKSKHLQEQLRILKNEIEVLKVEEKQTPMDLIHEDNVLHGETKYSTLRKIRTRTTQSRVAFFEEL
ncbi:hypothetical protein CHUAL_005772 [Chamberlinius hualienensis]